MSTSISIMQRFAIGRVLYVFSTISKLALEVTAHSLYTDSGHNNQTLNQTLRCLVHVHPQEHSPTLGIDYHWLAIPNALSGVSILILIIAAIEFICAQSPYSMKGLIMGTVYLTTGICIALSEAL